MRWHPARRVLRAAAPVFSLQRPGAHREEAGRVLGARQQRYPQPRGVLDGTEEDAGRAQGHRGVRHAFPHVVYCESDPGIGRETVGGAEADGAEEARITAPL